MNIILSIKPKYIERILSGEKKIRVPEMGAKSKYYLGGEMIAR